MTHGLALGAALMFVLDPRRGSARRAYVRDKSIRVSHELEDAARVGARDLSHRVEGAIARVLTPDENVSEDVLVARVRSRLGHVCTHAHAIQVAPKGDGSVELKGPILADEKQHVLTAISHVRGVHAIDDDLETHAQPDISALQCAHRPPPRRQLSRYWTPATRLVVGASAAVLALGSLLLGHPMGFVLGGVGTLRIARSIERRNLPRRHHIIGVNEPAQATEGTPQPAPTRLETSKESSPDKAAPESAVPT